MPVTPTASCSGPSLAQIVVVIVVLTVLPETAHQDLDDLNPVDKAVLP